MKFAFTKRSMTIKRAMRTPDIMIYSINVATPASLHSGVLLF